MTQAISGLESLNVIWNLRLNKIKSHVHIEDDSTYMTGVLCTNKVNFMLVSVSLDLKVQRE